jgi:DNA-binding NarL/FixJ family response regulator
MLRPLEGGPIPHPLGRAVTTRVLIVHEHLANAEALEALVDAQDDLRSVGVVTDVADVVLALGRHPTDVVLVDIDQAVRDELRAHDLGVRIVAMTTRVTVGALERAIQLGATGLVGRDAPASELINGLRNRSPRMTVSGTTLDLLLADARGWLELSPPRPTQRTEPHVRLTRRERDVLRLMREGLDAKTIASDLHVSVHTARSHIKKLLAKLGAHSQLEAVAIANRLQLENHDRPN